MSENITLREIYRRLRDDKDMHRVLAAIWTPLVLLILGLAMGVARDKKRQEQRVKRRERWRQEVRDEEGEG